MQGSGLGPRSSSRLRRCWAATLLLVLVLSGGAPDRGVEPQPAVLKLYVTNQHRHRAVMPITVEIDGEQVFAQDLDVGNQHHFAELTLPLAEGTRRIATRANDGTRLDESFVMPDGGERWGVLSYASAVDATVPTFHWNVTSTAPLFG